jgi:hypothetical protein
MPKDNLYMYGTIFLFVIAAWFLSSFVKTSITGFAVSNATQTEATVDINEFISLTLQEGFPIDFGSLNPGTTNSTATTNPSNLTIGDETNIDFNITLNASSNFVSESTGYNIGAGNMSFYTTNVTDQTNFVLDTEHDAYYWQACPCGSQVNESIWFYIDIPAGQRAAADYSANMTIKALG